MKFPISDCIIIGAGAAGLFCAGRISQQGKHVVILEHNEHPGKKIRISGGGRCNFTNRVVTAKQFISDNPYFAVSALTRYTPEHFISLIESYGIAYHEKTLGQLFCDHSSKDIIQMLLQECDQEYIDIQYGINIHSIRKDEYFEIETSKGTLYSTSLVIASGGLSIPSLGASNIGYTIAKQFGHSLIDTRPALVPLTVENTLFPCSQLAGVSFEVEVATENSPIFKESMLFTHKGISGPAILQISSYAHKDQSFTINALPGFDPIQLSDVSRKSDWKTVLGHVLPKRFSELWTHIHQQYEVFGHYSERSIAQFIRELQDWHFSYSGTEGYAKAEVTAGGVNTKELSSKTMMSSLQPNLYFIGEVVDVTGHLGGYNFQWAWSSAHAASESIIGNHG
ncbi:MAG: NAD(P)/FAD-dependent oxidoreductase [Ignavibacteria bacterium]